MVSLVSLALIGAPALAAEGDDPDDVLWERLAREQGLPALLGSSDRSSIARAGALFIAPLPVEGARAAAERARLETEWAAVHPDAWGDNPWWSPTWGARAYARLSEGDYTPVGTLGDEEPGLFSTRVAAELTGRSPWLEVLFDPEIRVDVGASEEGASPFQFVPTASRYFVGMRRGPMKVGFGAEPRSAGPGRRGNLILGDDAATWPAGVVAGEGDVWKLGRFRAEVTAGWLDRPRRDVQRPGMMTMDFRWSPIPAIEMGLARASLFGGEGRPQPKLGQLLIPTDPHVYDDPDREEPDQDEIAGFDGRLTIPLTSLLGGRLGLRYLDLWIEYAGEDVIAARLGSVPYPSLAGVANLRGAELAVDRLMLTVEWARLMDDYFRWYTGHRVYHEGFTQLGHSLGHPGGGDQQTWWMAATWAGDTLGVQGWSEHLWRVGVAEVVGDGVFTFVTDERRWRHGLRGWYFLPGGGHVGLGVQLEQLTGEDFVPGADGLNHRVQVEWRSGPWRWRPTL